MSNTNPQTAKLLNDGTVVITSPKCLMGRWYVPEQFDGLRDELCAATPNETVISRINDTLTEAEVEQITSTVEYAMTYEATA